MRPQSSTGFGENICTFKKSVKTTLYTLIQERVLPAPVTWKRPEERGSVVDSGASMHMMSKKE